jgi:hypothetical protein
MGATGTYVRAGLPEVATALSVLTGEPHPLAPEGPRTDIKYSLIPDSEVTEGTAAAFLKETGLRRSPLGEASLMTSRPG